MARSRSRRRRALPSFSAVRLSRAEIVKAVLFGVLGLGLAYLTFAASITNIAHRRNPELALRFSPNDPEALAALAATRLNNPAAVRDQSIAELARRSLTGQGLNPVALRVIGLMASGQGNVAAGRPAMLLADRMSRRDLLTQLWLIEEAVGRDDVGEALRRYDIALRISAESPQILFPVLAGALESHEPLATAFLPYIRDPAPWLGEFVNYAVRNTRRPVALARLFERAGGLPDNALFAALETELLRRLADSGAHTEAARYYLSLGGTDPAVLRTVSFTNASVDTRFAPIAWEAFAVADVSSTFLQSESGEALELHATLETPALSAIARKIAVYPAGRYRFRADQWLAAGSSGRATWELHCGNTRGGRQLWSASSVLGSQRQRVDAAIEIPAGCGVVTLRVLAAAGGEGGSVEAVFSGVALVPAGG